MKANRSRQILAARSREKARQRDQEEGHSGRRDDHDQQFDQPVRPRRDPDLRVRTRNGRAGW
jgi:hypothetical protein